MIRVDPHLVTLILLGIILLFFGTLVGYIIGYTFETKELGRAICEKEYGMDFKVYSGDTLKCKDKVVQKHYDGIKVIQINEGEE